MPRFEMEVHEHGDQYISHELTTLGRWEPFETSVIRRFLDSDTEFYDIGANIGWYSVVAGLTIGVAAGPIHAFEPVRDNAALLTRNISRNSLTNVRVNPYALGDRTDVVDMHLSPTNKGDHQVDGSAPDRQTQRCGMARFDTYHAPSLRKILIKIDTQGSELSIIEGMGRYLGSIRNLTMVIEFWPVGLERRPGSTKRLIEKLASHGFGAFSITEDDGRIRPADWDILERASMGPIAPETGGFVNLLLVRNRDVLVREFEDLYDSVPSHHLI
ncbi:MULTISPECIES: FkbM family methyltransferase [Sphingobium]|uniref:FkbM family methyltransferase n=1 Tax=Sphingobium TaxID=165695 RepID=UPI001615CAF3|nr:MULTISPECIES: FkbM family methyltransferase [Sphingobium]MCW2408925.1 FkbM family methyltransferase [Sphingobium xanthum]